MPWRAASPRDRTARYKNSTSTSSARPSHLPRSPAWPAPGRMREPAPDVPRQHHRARGAEQIADHHNPHDEKAAPVDRRQDRGEIARGELRTEQSVQYSRGGDQEQNELQRRPCVSPAKESADGRQLQDVHSLGCGTHARDFDSFLQLTTVGQLTGDERIQSPAIENCSGASYVPSPRSTTSATTGAMRDRDIRPSRRKRAPITGF